MKTVITFGTFDLLHVGHIRILERAKSQGDRLIVGVSSDSLNFKKKGKYPVYREVERMEIIRSIGVVDEVFLEESLEKKLDYVKQYGADILIMGNDWSGKFDFCGDNCQVKYLDRTPSISTTEIVEKIICDNLKQ